MANQYTSISVKELFVKDSKYTNRARLKIRVLKDKLIKYVIQEFTFDNLLWTHVTSPFITSEIHDQIIEKYLEKLEDFDSLMTVTKLQKFIWKDSKPVNYNRNFEKWPKTQTIEPLWEVNSGIFLAHKSIYESNKDRIGNTPYLFELSDERAFDIDWMTDYKIAEVLYYSMHQIPKVSINRSKKLTKEKILTKRSFHTLSQ